MTLTLELTPEQERRLTHDAAAQGLDTQSYIMKSLLGAVPQTDERISEERAGQIGAAKELRGKYAHVPGTVDDFISEKRREMEREDRF